jgi:MFS family permease
MHTGQRQAPLATPVCGLLSDRIGRKPLLLASCAALAAVPPLFIVVLANPSFELIVIAQLLVALIIALYIGPAPAAIAELFATTTRTTSLSTANGIAVAIFGGFSPLHRDLVDQHDRLGNCSNILCDRFSRHIGACHIEPA